MKLPLRLLMLGLLLLVAPVAADAAVAVAPIFDKTVGADDTLNVRVGAVDPDGGAITLSASLPTFATLNEPTSGTGSVATSITLMPLAADIGSHAATVTATVGETSATEPFQITVVASDANLPPYVTAPALVTGAEASPIQFTVTASDPDGDAIESLTATNLPAGASFTAGAGNTSGDFAWTPDLKQAGEYDVTFVAANAQADSAATHLSVAQSDLGPVALAPIADVEMMEGDSLDVAVLATDPDEETIELTASLPAFATLNAPTSSAGAESLATSITIEPGDGTAGTYPASVTATSGGDTATEDFTIVVKSPALPATASLIGSFNDHKKFLCFKVWPVDSSFSLLDVSLQSLTLNYHGNSVGPVRPTHLAYDCDAECDSCGEGEGPEYGDGDRYRRGAAQREGYGDGESDSCQVAHIMACFSMSDIRTLFDGAALPDSFAVATIEGELNDGRTFVATIGGKHVVDGGEGRGKPDEPKPWPHDGKGKLDVRIRPNPMNPDAEIGFTLASAGHVRIAIYDVAGRLVKTVREGSFPAGSNSVTWNGSTDSGRHATSGVYFVTVESNDARVVQRVTVLK